MRTSIGWDFELLNQLFSFVVRLDRRISLGYDRNFCDGEQCQDAVFAQGTSDGTKGGPARHGGPLSPHQLWEREYIDMFYLKMK